MRKTTLLTCKGHHQQTSTHFKFKLTIHHHHNYGYRKIRCSLWFLPTEHLSPEDLKCQGYPFVQNHPFTMPIGIALAHPRTTTFQRKNLCARSDQMQCSNTAAAEALLHLQSSHIQLNAPSRQPAGFQTKLYSSVGLNQHGSLEDADSMF
jgi:hypothetical protein